ncbi:uncharacterized protein LOC117561507 isoform X2 [Scomber scombrus]|uniref:Uncharacterized protein LOC117561507 isoform X2 n=1 Tax=Scomber scombrus TaxID=13677 RepID=A0AAV1NZF6_SCOSC
MEYPEDILAVHASSCGDSLEEEAAKGEDMEKSTGGEIKSLDDIIQAIQDAVVTDDVKTFNPLTFNLKAEHGMIEGIETRFFELGTHGRRPMYSLSDLYKGYFRTIGEIVAASLAQGGPALNFLMQWCYHVLCTGSLDIEKLTRSDVGHEYTDLLSSVKVATEVSIKDLTQEILNCGYTGHICCEKKDEIIRAIVLHGNLRLLPMLLQIREGLTLYGLSDIMAKYPDICTPLFVPGLEMKADADFILSVCKAQFSEAGSNKEQVEQTIMTHLQDFLQELEQDEADSGLHLAGCPSLSPRAFLQWITGQGHVPVLQKEKRRFKVNIKFNHDC